MARKTDQKKRGDKQEPAHVFEFAKKRHRSNKEIEDRENRQIKIDDKELVLPLSVKRDKVALKKWKYLVSIYSTIDNVAVADSDIIAQYCLCHSELEELLKTKTSIEKDLKTQDKTTLEIFKELTKSNIDNMINKKRDALNKIGGKILLDPTSRMKAVPAKAPEKPKTGLEKFGMA